MLPYCVPLASSWKELSGSELQLVAKAFEERGASNAAAVQGAAAGGSGSPSSRKEWERYGARYFKGVVNMKKGRGKERNIELQVEVRSSIVSRGWKNEGARVELL